MKITGIHKETFKKTGYDDYFYHHIDLVIKSKKDVKIPIDIFEEISVDEFHKLLKENEI
jgi:hypothetical protein